VQSGGPASTSRPLLVSNRSLPPFVCMSETEDRVHGLAPECGIPPLPPLSLPTASGAFSSAHHGCGSCRRRASMALEGDTAWH
jgi:hypothetical protein